MGYENKHVDTFMKAASTINRLESEIAPLKEFETERFGRFLQVLKLGDRIHWTEIDGHEYEGTAIAYLNSETANFGVKIAMEYGTANITMNKAPVIVKAWMVVE